MYKGLYRASEVQKYPAPVANNPHYVSWTFVLIGVTMLPTFYAKINDVLK